MDGDGAPEIIVHENGGDSWHDVVMKRSEGAWEVVASSVGGSTA
jgi:hypothetical protein